MSIGRICQREVDLVDICESIQTAAERMLQRSVGTLVVIDDEKMPSGIITDRDIVLRVTALKRNPEKTLVGEVMTKVLSNVTEDTPIEDALDHMRSVVCRRLPVVNEDGKLKGVVSLDDILLLISEEFTKIGKLLEKESPISLAQP